jgi:hypothetical protein
MKQKVVNILGSVFNLLAESELVKIKGKDIENTAAVLGAFKALIHEVDEGTIVVEKAPEPQPEDFEGGADEVE